MPNGFADATVKVKTKVPQKICVKCGKSLPGSEFYNNKEWKDAGGKDCWCKECISKINTKEGLLEYFWENNRKWKDTIWTRARTMVEKTITVNPTFVNADSAKRQHMLEVATTEQVFKIMNVSGCYFYEEHKKSYAEAVRSGQVSSDDDEEKEYSPFFNGYFTPEDIEYLNEYYKHLEHDFDLDTENLRDYARKLAKASLQADKAQADYASGKCDLKVVNDALAQFDMLSKSANFAACKRKATDTAATNSWSEISYILETTGHTCQRKIEWAQDDIDKTIQEYRHIIESVGIDLA